MCGMGKTGTIHAWQQEGIRGPDIQTIGKALGGGFIPLSAVLLHQRIFEALESGSGGLAHGHTFQVCSSYMVYFVLTSQAHPAACASALAVQKIISDEALIDRVRVMGKVLERLLCAIVGPLALVGDIRGRGLFWAVEFMLNSDERIPPPREAKFSERVVNRALELGLNILGNLGVTGQIYVDHVIICPPYVVTEDELERIVAILAQAIQDITKEMALWMSGTFKLVCKENGYKNGYPGSHTNGYKS